MTAIHETDRTTPPAIPEDLAEEVLFWGAKQIDDDQRDGTRFSSAAEALRSWGQPAEHLWPYEVARDHRGDDYEPPPEAIEPGNCFTASIESMPTESDAILTELRTGRPIVLGIPLWEGLRRADVDPLPAPDVSEVLPIRHAVVIAGIDLDRGALLIRNSWGDGWGDKGYWWVSVEVLDIATAAWRIINQVDG